MPIWWLASYPKSGNTWLRVLLTNYIEDRPEPAHVNALYGSGEAVSRDVFDELVGIESASLTPAQIDAYRPLVYSMLSAHRPEPWYLKTHERYRLNDAGAPLFPRQGTSGVVYVVRNPLDVAVSYAHHLNWPIDRAIDWMANDDATLADRDGVQLRQPLGSWSSHVDSWMGQSDLNVHVVRYEDMASRPHETFAGVIRFLGLGVDDERLARAVAFSSFEIVQAQEAADGFRERQPTATSFFRAGKADGWQGALTGEQAARVLDSHHDTMQRCKYLCRLDYVS